MVNHFVLLEIRLHNFQRAFYKQDYPYDYKVIRRGYLSSRSLPRSIRRADYRFYQMLFYFMANPGQTAIINGVKYQKRRRANSRRVLSIYI